MIETFHILAQICELEAVEIEEADPTDVTRMRAMFQRGRDPHPLVAGAASEIEALARHKDDVEHLRELAGRLRLHIEEWQRKGVEGMPNKICLICEGSGSITSDEPYMMMQGNTCWNCHGSGRKDQQFRASLPPEGQAAFDKWKLTAKDGEAFGWDPEMNKRASGIRARSTLPQIRQDLGDCRRCGLCQTRQSIVFGEGPESAQVAFVGEAPGADEDRSGLPFQGQAGALLDKMLDAMHKEAYRQWRDPEAPGIDFKTLMNERAGMFKRENVRVLNTVMCLTYQSNVQLEDGSWVRIGKLVGTRYAGKVMSVGADGRLEPKRVIGWHSSPLAGRKLFKLSYKSSLIKAGRKATTTLTEDHTVLTKRGWIRADRLQPSDQVAIGTGLSDVARQVVIGSILGDGHLAAKSASLEITHIDRNTDYLELKAGALAELGVLIFKRYPTATSLRTNASRSIKLIRDTWKIGSQTIVPEDWFLTPLTLAVWFLDDGYMRVKGNGGFAELACHNFTDLGIEKLISKLQSDLGLTGYTRESSRGRIHFDQENSRKLSSMVSPYCPESMRYKLLPAQSNAFVPSLYTGGFPIVDYDFVDCQETEWRDGKNLYCLDVEDNHNFVSSGGVVHNCRPPLNRKPDPEEVSQCAPFLERQLMALPNLKVIITLGATPATALLPKFKRLSDIRGRWQEWRGIPLMPTWHPAYLLRDPSHKGETWEDLKLVIERMK